MTNIQSIAGGAGWAIISLLLIFAALEPVSTGKDQPQLAATQDRAAQA